MGKKHAMLGKVVEKVVGLPEDNLGILYDLTTRLAGSESFIYSQELKKFLRKKDCWVDLFNPHHAFRKGQKGLWHSENFEKYILLVAKKITSVHLPDHISGFDLPEDMNDDEIRAKLGDNHIFEASEGCAVIGGMMISRQFNGKKGDLLVNGCANIFYIRGLNKEVFAVFVYWCSGGRRWSVSAYRLGDGRWGAGDRAFSRNRHLDK